MLRCAVLRRSVVEVVSPYQLRCIVWRVRLVQLYARPHTAVSYHVVHT